jgi:hypothetical protein
LRKALKDKTTRTTSAESRYGFVFETAVAEDLRLDGQKAPQREIERQKKQAEEDRAERQQARRVDIAAFRP